MRSTRSKKTKKKDISSEYFVGYVEDDESIEAIMKKFQELDEIKSEFLKNSKEPVLTETAEPGASSDQLQPASTATTSDKTSDEKNEEGEQRDSTVLPQELLAEVFKRTSAFTVKGAMMDEVDLQGLDDVELWRAEMEDGDYYNLQEDDFWDDEYGLPGKSRLKSGRRGGPRFSNSGDIKTSLRDQILQRYKYMQIQVKDKRGFTFFIKRRVLTVDPYSPTYVRIPPIPIPRSWVNTIQSLDGPDHLEYSIYKSVPKITEINWKEYSSYHAVYMDPPLISGRKQGDFGVSDKTTLEQLRSIPINKILRPGGFLFIWSQKEFLPQIFSISETVWNLKYVENFCWIKKLTNNRISRSPSRYFCKSKLTCLIFRNSGDIEMRHQRSPDCVFDFIKPKLQDDDTEFKPEFVYNVIETLLPASICSAESPIPNRLLNLVSLVNVILLMSGAFLVGMFASKSIATPKPVSPELALKKSRLSKPVSKKSSPIDYSRQSKLTLVVRADLGMTKGKVAAQCCHAALACYKTSMKKDPNAVRQWEETGQAKITLKCNSEHELLDLYKKAKSLGIVAEYIQDAGRTQIAPGSRTVLGIGPCFVEDVDQVTGELKLY
ncbi:Peptidyl-tRNA hydrolase 2, mitochondrial [Smittium mucronatum]|uniref:peptidyl-tRNA hydrolase n=1 Tax=Smittium mucronatum TaxID=133383 RepID=A0A1R0H126_9FUNG|nr:Peptidyl-tRNA hydrolase 2, mitochondrial [Smittium mucronatum]